MGRQEPDVLDLGSESDEEPVSRTLDGAVQPRRLRPLERAQYVERIIARSRAARRSPEQTLTMARSVSSRTRQQFERAEREAPEGGEDEPFQRPTSSRTPRSVRHRSEFHGRELFYKLVGTFGVVPT